MAIRFAPERVNVVIDLHEGGNVSRFARRIGGSRQKVDQWINCTVTPSIGSLIKICNEYGVEVEFFFEEIM